MLGRFGKLSDLIVEKDFYDRSDGITTEIPDRLETNVVADNVSFDEALRKISELIGNSVSED